MLREVFRRPSQTEEWQYRTLKAQNTTALEPRSEQQYDYSLFQGSVVEVQQLRRIHRKV